MMKEGLGKTNQLQCDINNRGALDHKQTTIVLAHILSVLDVHVRTVTSLRCDINCIIASDQLENEGKG